MITPPPHRPFRIPDYQNLRIIECACYECMLLIKSFCLKSNNLYLITSYIVHDTLSFIKYLTKSHRCLNYNYNYCGTLLVVVSHNIWLARTTIRCLLKQTRTYNGTDVKPTDRTEYVTRKNVQKIYNSNK